MPILPTLKYGVDQKIVHLEGTTQHKNAFSMFCGRYYILQAYFIRRRVNIQACLYRLVLLFKLILIKCSFRIFNDLEQFTQLPADFFYKFFYSHVSHVQWPHKVCRHRRPTITSGTGYGRLRPVRGSQISIESLLS